MVEIRVRELLEKVGVELAPRETLLIYGAPMVRKSLFSVLLAREYNLDLKILALEPSWRELKYLELMRKYIPEGSELIHLTINGLWSALFKLSRLNRSMFIIVDSLSVLADEIVKAVKRAEPLAVVSRASMLMRVVAYELKKCCINTNSIGVIICQATGAPQAFRAIAQLKPSVATRVGHYCTYMVLLEIGSEPEERILTVVANRVKPYMEGRSVVFTFSQLK